MSLTYSTAIANARLDQVETTIGTSAILKVRSGPAPATVATASSGTVLATASLPSDWMAAASSRSKAKSGTWEDTSADASGLAGHFEIIASDGTTIGMRGLCSQAWAATTAYLLNQQTNNGGLVYKCTTAGTSAGSGGPTGTGTGITDGTAVWAYVGTVDMVLDNTNFNAGQDFSVSAFSITAAN